MRRLGVLFLTILLAACGAEMQPAIVSPAPTFTPPVSPTTRPSATATFELLPTVTLAPTDTPQRVAGAATSPLRATFTLAPATQTATFQPQRVGLAVEYFITNTENPTPSENLTLFWRLTGANSARIFRLNEEDQRTQVWNVNTEGRLTVTIDPEAELVRARFLLQGEANGSVVEDTLEVLMTGCNLGWFFQQAPQGCPTDVPSPTSQAEQRFEGGLMIWLGTTQEIYVLYADGSDPTWQVFPDNYTDNQPASDESLVPPPDRLQPVRGFGLVWRENTELQDRLGWAVEAEVGYDGIIQTSPQEVTYLRLRDGGIIAISPESWEVLPAAGILEAVPPGDPSLITPTVEETPQQ